MIRSVRKNEVVWRVRDVCANTEKGNLWKTEEKQCGERLRRVTQQKCVHV